MIRVTLDRLDMPTLQEVVVLGGGLCNPPTPALDAFERAREFAPAGRRGDELAAHRRSGAARARPAGCRREAKRASRRELGDAFRVTREENSRGDLPRPIGKESMMKRVIVLAVAVGLLATACGGGKSGGGSSGSSVTISNEQGTTWTCGFNPFNGQRAIPLVRPGVRGAHVRKRPEERLDHELARLVVRVEQQQQDADVHDPSGCQVERREAAHRGGRPLHVQPDQGAPGARSQRRLGGAEERQPERRQGRLRLQVLGGAVLLLHRRADADRPAARLVEDLRPGHVQGHVAGGLRPVQDELLLAAGDQVREELRLLAEGEAVDRHGLLPRLHLERAGEPAAGEREGAVGKPVHPEHQQVLPGEEREQPLLVPAAGQCLDLHQPEGPDPRPTSRFGRRWHTPSTGPRSRR